MTIVEDVAEDLALIGDALLEGGSKLGKTLKRGVAELVRTHCVRERVCERETEGPMHTASAYTRTKIATAPQTCTLLRPLSFAPTEVCAAAD
jgi:hypothetical protein